MIIKYTGNRGPAVGRWIYRIGAQSQSPVPVTSASWRFAGLLHDRQAGRERRIHGLLHRDLHQPPFPGTGTLQQRSNYAPVKVNSRQTPQKNISVAPKPAALTRTLSIKTAEA